VTLRRAGLLLASALLAPLAAADTAWISDVFFVPLRSGPSDNNRIVHRGLPSGTVLEVLQEDADSGYTRVRTPGGLDGWISSQYVVREPIAAVALDAANKRIEALERQLSQRGQTLTELRSSSSEASSTNQELTAQVAQLEGELAELKRISTDAIGVHARNEELTTLNARLRTEVDRLSEETQILANNLEQRWMLIGAGLVFGGLLAGLVLKARPRRSGWS
jgi:SH3 domain protein